MFALFLALDHVESWTPHPCEKGSDPPRNTVGNPEIEKSSHLKNLSHLVRERPELTRLVAPELLSLSRNVFYPFVRLCRGLGTEMRFGVEGEPKLFAAWAARLDKSRVVRIWSGTRQRALTLVISISGSGVKLARLEEHTLE